MVCRELAVTPCGAVLITVVWKWLMCMMKIEFLQRTRAHGVVRDCVRSAWRSNGRQPITDAEACNCLAPSAAIIDSR